MERGDVERWISEYEAAWRSPGTAALTTLFAPDVEYLPSPWDEPITGLSALAAFWDAERDGPDEPFTMRWRVIALEDATAVVRVEVEYEAPAQSWRDLWVLTFDTGGRCTRYEEWPFAPEQDDGH